MQNLEYKAELRDISLARTLAGTCGALPIETMRQIDTYYRMFDGLLKRREIAGRPAEWILYSRPIQSHPKLSTFEFSTDADAKLRYGERPMTPWLTVTKVRELWTYQGVRIHLDKVETLGEFIEFEALIHPDRDIEKAREQLAFLRERFATAMGEPIAIGYAEMLANQEGLEDTPLVDWA